MIAYQSRHSKSWLLLKGWGSPGQQELSDLPSKAVGHPQRWLQVQITRQGRGDNTGLISSQEVKPGSCPASLAEVRRSPTVARQVHSDKTARKTANMLRSAAMKTCTPTALLWKEAIAPSELKWCSWAVGRVGGDPRRG